MSGALQACSYSDAYVAELERELHAAKAQLLASESKPVPRVTLTSKTHLTAAQIRQNPNIRYRMLCSACASVIDLPKDKIRAGLESICRCVVNGNRIFNDALYATCPSCNTELEIYGNLVTNFQAGRIFEVIIEQ